MLHIIYLYIHSLGYAHDEKLESKGFILRYATMLTIEGSQSFNI